MDHDPPDPTDRTIPWLTAIEPASPMPGREVPAGDYFVFRHEHIRGMADPGQLVQRWNLSGTIDTTVYRVVGVNEHDYTLAPVRGGPTLVDTLLDDSWVDIALFPMPDDPRVIAVAGLAADANFQGCPPIPDLDPNFVKAALCHPEHREAFTEQWMTSYAAMEAADPHHWDSFDWDAAKLGTVYEGRTARDMLGDQLARLRAAIAAELGVDPDLVGPHAGHPQLDTMLERRSDRAAAAVAGDPTIRAMVTEAIKNRARTLLTDPVANPEVATDFLALHRDVLEPDEAFAAHYHRPETAAAVGAAAGPLTAHLRQRRPPPRTAASSPVRERSQQQLPTLGTSTGQTRHR